MQKKCSQRIKGWAVCDIRTSISQYRYNSVRHVSALPRQIVRQAMCTIDEWW